MTPPTKAAGFRRRHSTSTLQRWRIGSAFRLRTCRPFFPTWRTLRHQFLILWGSKQSGERPGLIKPGTGHPLHTQEPVTVASFRTWRGWRECVARDRCLTAFDSNIGFDGLGRCTLKRRGLVLNSVGVGEPLGNQSGVKYTIVPNADGDHAIIVLHLGGVDVVELLAAVLLADPPSAAIVVNDPLNV